MFIFYAYKHLKAIKQALAAAKYLQWELGLLTPTTAAARACYASRGALPTHKTKEIHKCFGYSVSH
jgi:hypothetical protein